MEGKKRGLFTSYIEHKLFFLGSLLGGFKQCVCNLHSIHVMYSLYFRHKELGSHSYKYTRLVQGHTSFKVWIQTQDCRILSIKSQCLAYPERISSVFKIYLFSSLNIFPSYKKHIPGEKIEFVLLCELEVPESEK